MSKNGVKNTFVDGKESGVVAICKNHLVGYDNIKVEVNSILEFGRKEMMKPAKTGLSLICQ